MKKLLIIVLVMFSLACTGQTTKVPNNISIGDYTKNGKVYINDTLLQDWLKFHGFVLGISSGEFSADVEIISYNDNKYRIVSDIPMYYNQRVIEVNDTSVFLGTEGNTKSSWIPSNSWINIYPEASATFLETSTGDSKGINFYDTRPISNSPVETKAIFNQQGFKYTQYDESLWSDSSLITKKYADDNYGGSGGISDAPSDGNLYGRKDAAWEVVPSGVTPSGISGDIQLANHNILGIASDINPGWNLSFADSIFHLNDDSYTNYMTFSAQKRSGNIRAFDVYASDDNAGYFNIYGGLDQTYMENYNIDGNGAAIYLIDEQAILSVYHESTMTENNVILDSLGMSLQNASFSDSWGDNYFITKGYADTSYANATPAYFTGSLTDNAPLINEIIAIAGIPSVSGTTVTIKDNDGTALLYICTYDGNSWWFYVMSPAIGD